MGKLTAIKTREVFDSLLTQNKIEDSSVTFIVDTGQIYTHGIFINGASYGTEASGAINLIIGGTTKSLSLSSHTHSEYYTNNTNLNISTYKIVSGTKDLVQYDSGTKIGDASVPLILIGSTDVTIQKGSTSYTNLDTENFSVVEETYTGISSLNAFTVKYGSNKVSINYPRLINTSTLFDNLTAYTNVGINTIDSKVYGTITLSNSSLPLIYSQLRINTSDHEIEFRDSGSTTWKKLITSTTLNALGVAGLVAGPTANDANKVWGTDSSGNPGWTDSIDINTLTSSNLAGGAAGSIPYLSSSGTTAFLAAGTDGYVLSYNANSNAPYWKAITNSDKTGIKLATVSGTLKTDSTVIINNSSTGLSIEGGTNKFLIGDGINYIEVEVNHGLDTKNLNINGTNYALYTSANSLPTLYAVATSDTTTADQVWMRNADNNGYAWRTLGSRAFDSTEYVPTTDFTLNTITTNSIALGNTGWTDTGLSNSTTGLTTTGTYAIQIKQDTGYYSGIFTWYAGTGGMSEEVVLHYAGNTTPTRMYMKTEDGKIYLAADNTIAAATYQIKIRKLI